MTMRSDFPNETRLHCSFKLDLDNYYDWRSDKCTQGRHSLSRAGMICASFVERNTWPIYESLRRHTLAERFLFLVDLDVFGGATDTYLGFAQRE